MNGEQIQADIYIGPTYYMRLKHMVKDKINYRATGPRTNLTRQTVQGRANDGGLRIGEMERDGVLAHGMSYFLNESFLVRGDEYFMAVCNKTGAIAIYNENKNLFLSPFADGPVNFHTNPDGSLNIKNISKFGRSFSLLRIPYSFKLLIQELQAMNIQMRIITDDNVDQLLSLSFSNNIGHLLHTESTDLESNIINVKTQIRSSLTKDKKQSTRSNEFSEENEAVNPFEKFEEPKNPFNPTFINETDMGPRTPSDSPPPTPVMGPRTPSDSPPPTPVMGPRTPSDSPPFTPNFEISQPQQQPQQPQEISILEVEEPVEKKDESNELNEQNNSSESNQGEKKVIITNLGNNSNSEGEKQINVPETKKIIL